jgi:small-conductance mechanosensitive channel
MRRLRGHVPVDGLLVALAGSSVGIGFALQPPLTNLFAGLMLPASRRFQSGQHIRLSSGQEGRVIDLDWLTTTLGDGDENIVAVPKATMLRATVVNFDLPDPRMWISVPLAVSRDSDMERVERATLEVTEAVIQEVPGCTPDSPPRLRYPLGLDEYVNRRGSTSAHAARTASARPRSRTPQVWRPWRSVPGP